MCKRIGLVLVIAALVLAALPVNVWAQEADEPVRTGLRPDAPPYGVRGPHSVGARDLVIDSDSPLEVTIWYPALNTEGVEEEITYAYEVKLDFMPDAVATVSGHAIRDAPAELSASPYPLVILSPGFSMGRTTYAWLAEHLVSYGFVVIAPEHHEIYDENWSDFWRATVTRPQDVLTVIAYADELTGAGGTLEGLINTDLMAVTGHSYGGFTALAAAGARFDINGFTTRCDAAREADDPGVWVCDLLLPHVADMAALAGLDPVPEGLWPAWADPRVDAIVPMAGDAYIFDQAGLAEITIPVMAIGGTLDGSTPYEWGAHPTYEYVSSANNAIVAFESARHNIFGSTCEALPFFADMGFYTACSDPVWDMDRAHDLINHFTTAFLLAELYGDKEAAAALSLEAVHFPGIAYETTGY
jgi:predicted dienelactone hydrolase